jgi:protein-tyrosine phosphatase
MVCSIIILLITIFLIPKQQTYSYISKIKPNLYIGPLLDNNYLQHMDAVVSVCETYMFRHVPTLWIPIRDDIYTNIRPLFEKTNAFIDKYVSAGKNVYVHCHCGVS